MNENQRGRHYPEISYLCVCLILVLGLLHYVSSSDTPYQDEVFHEVGVSAEEKYWEKWHINISPYRELFSHESIHPAFGDGFRYSVLSGIVIVPTVSRNSYGEEITVITGTGADPNAIWFLNDVWTSLKVPFDQRCSLRDSDWTKLSLKDGSRLLLINLPNSNLCYIAECLS